MSSDRRTFLKGLGSAALLTLAYSPESIAQYIPTEFTHTPVNVMIPRDYRIPTGSELENYKYRLTRATLDLLEEHYSSKPIPVWDKTFREIDMEKRISNIVFWLLKGVENHQAIYPVDPAWAISMIMKESYFYEFAISKALAIGICQFVQPTALSYNMICAGQQTAHKRSPYKLIQYASEATRYYELRTQRRAYRRKYRPKNRFTIQQALQVISDGASKADKEKAQKQLAYEKRYSKFSDDMIKARENYRNYLLANVKGRDIFNRRDVQFLVGFEERFTYKKPLDSMVKMLASSLRARSGNILAAAIGYNAGLSSTKAVGRYEPFGRIPAIEQSTTYLSHILVNHHDITSRM
ncbi:MAG: transglycosylase SLT domain-containing protein [Calditrichota bacterium]